MCFMRIILSLLPQSEPPPGVPLSLQSPCWSIPSHRNRPLSIPASGGARGSRPGEQAVTQPCEPSLSSESGGQVALPRWFLMMASYQTLTFSLLSFLFVCYKDGSDNFQTLFGQLNPEVNTHLNK